MSDQEKKYPIPVAGVFIFNENEELLLGKGKKFHNKYTNIGGKIELNETVEQAAVREAKEETGLDIYDLRLIGVIDGLELGKIYEGKYNHLIFLDYRAKTGNSEKIILNEEFSEFKWLKLDEWLKKDVSKFAPYIMEALKKLKQEKEKEDFENKYKRALADYQNLLKNSAREKQDFAQFANEQFLHEILPVYNNLKLAYNHAQNTSDKTSTNIVEGIKYVIKQFKDILEKAGVEEIETKGKKFDHNTMEAVEGKGDKVRKEVAPGYKLRGKMIIPAKVILE